jgi:hypothetical protein
VRKIGLLVIAALVMVPALAGADSIVPASYSATIAVGATATLNKTVTISTVATGAVDVFFLADTTGSMGGAISNVKTNIGEIIGNVAAVASNVAYGVGEYRDQFDSFVYRKNADPTTSLATVQAAVNGWSAGGGGDWEEANLYALSEVASGSTNTAWRPDSERLVMWFGDAPGHDPSAFGVTEAQATAALVGAGAKVYGINVGDLDYSGQASRIAAATGGAYYDSIDSSALSNAIIAAITGAVTNYSLVSLDVIGLTPGLTISFTPSAYSGAWDRSVENIFDFQVGFRGDAPGVYNFEIVAKVDGAIVARETDSITVGGEPIPEPASLLLFGTGLVGAAKLRRRRR